MHCTNKEDSLAGKQQKDSYWHQSSKNFVYVQKIHHTFAQTTNKRFFPSISVFLLEIAILLKQNHPLFFPENIQQEVLINLEWDEQKRLLDQTVNLPALVKYPLQPKYVVSFLRAIIDRLEKQSIDVHDDLYKQMCDAQAEEETDYSYKHYMPNSDTTAPSVILKESKNKISEGTTGLNIWESSMAMAELALSRKELFQGRNIVELGAGCGFGGIVIAKYCEPNKVTISDGDYTVLDLLEDNVSINFEFNERKSHYWNDRSGTIVSEWFIVYFEILRHMKKF